MSQTSRRVRRRVAGVAAAVTVALGLLAAPRARRKPIRRQGGRSPQSGTNEPAHAAGAGESQPVERGPVHAWPAVTVDVRLVPRFLPAWTYYHAVDIFGELVMSDADLRRAEDLLDESRRHESARTGSE